MSDRTGKHLSSQLVETGDLQLSSSTFSFGPLHILPDLNLIYPDSFPFLTSISLNLQVVVFDLVENKEKKYTSSGTRKSYKDTDSVGSASRIEFRR